MQTDGFVYLPASFVELDESGIRGRHAWSSAVKDAARYVDSKLLSSGQGLECINSGRLQFKFARALRALAPPLRRVVETLERHVAAACGIDVSGLVIQDCYALLTPASETSAEARAPQRWHLDAVKKFPVSALLLRGARWTEFAEGPYSDFSAGVGEATLERWCAPWKDLRAPTWESESAEEWEHWTAHLHAAKLVTSTGAEEPECDWERLPVAPFPTADGGAPLASSAGDCSLFWSNKVHRGPGTDEGEERLVLFCSWMPVAERRTASGATSEKKRERATRGESASAGAASSSAASASASATASAKAQSETDYSFYDTHLEPKLILSQRARRSLKRHRTA